MAGQVLEFDKLGERKFEVGVSKGVLFPGSPANTVKGVVWNGLTNVTESPEGGDANDQYADNIKYLALRGAERFKGSIEAFTYPVEFEACMGNKSAKGGYFGQQSKSPFSFAYTTWVGNDKDGIEHHEKIHIVWNATVDPTEKAYETINDSPEAMTFSWNFDTVPLTVADGYRPSSLYTIEDTTENHALFQKVKDAIYGSSTTESHLLMPADILALQGA